MGMIGDMIAGAAEVGGGAAVKYGLNEQESIIQAERDARLEEATKKSQERGFVHADKTLESTQAHSEKILGKTQQFTQGENDRRMEFEQNQQTERIASAEKISEASNKLQAKANSIASGRLTLEQARAELENPLKEIELFNAATLSGLNAKLQEKGISKEEKASIKEQIRVLTGKDNDNVVLVPTGYDELTGKPNAYQIFDKRTLKFIDPKAGEGGGAGAKWDDKSGIVTVNGVRVPGLAKTKAEAIALAKNYKPEAAADTPAASTSTPKPIRGTSGTHTPAQGSDPKIVQRRILELQDRLGKNVNTTLEGKRKDEVELRQLIEKRDLEAGYARSGYSQDMPEVMKRK